MCLPLPLFVAGVWAFVSQPLPVFVAGGRAFVTLPLPAFLGFEVDRGSGKCEKKPVGQNRKMWKSAPLPPEFNVGKKHRPLC